MTDDEIPDDITDEDYAEADDLFELLGGRLADWADSNGDVEATSDGIDIGTAMMGISSLIHVTAHTIMCDSVQSLLDHPNIPALAELRLRELRGMYHACGGIHDVVDQPDSAEPQDGDDRA